MPFFLKRSSVSAVEANPILESKNTAVINANVQSFLDRKLI
jgi:hypothetical protein